MTKRVNRVIKSPGNKYCSLSDFPAVNDYILFKFPNISVSDIPIYLVSESAMNTNGFSGIGGFYVHHMRLIVVKKKISIGAGATKRKFDTVLQSHIKADVAIEDIVVHEMIHAVSGEGNRSNRRFVFDEEEFVYTNSIDFYKQKGMTHEDIVNKNFIPFCIQDIFNNKSELEKVLSELQEKHKINTPVLDDKLTNHSFNIFLGRNATKIVPIIVDHARAIGFHMIDLYTKYGRGVGVTKQIQDADASIRFQTIEFDDGEW